MERCTKHPDQILLASGFCFPCYQLARCAIRADLRRMLEHELANGKTIVEHFTAQPTAWSLTMTPAPFIPSAMNPAYLAEHLTARHFGFGTVLASTL